MNIHAMQHSTTIPYAYPKDKDTLYLRVRCSKDEVSSMRVFYKDRYARRGFFKVKSLKKSYATAYFDYFDADISLYRNRYAYYFEIRDLEGNRWYLDERGMKSERGKTLKVFQFPYIAEEDLYESPSWLKEAICYQIFPDRFFREEKGEPVSEETKLSSWGEKPGKKSFFGGNIRGITMKIPYLKELGITLLYLTPLFESTSNHKYNTRDYYRIDPNFGTFEETKELVKRCHENGIRVIFDAVFNHTGNDFFAFTDLLENQENSRYKNWYHVDSYPVSREKPNYYTFANSVSHMPKLNLHHQEARKYFLDVARYWVREIGIDGYRLDVCDELSHDFLQDLRKAVKKEDRDAILVGEIMHGSETFLEGRELDTIMNYPFRDAMTDYFARGKIGTEDFLNVLVHNQIIYREEMTGQMLNLLGSHDTPRFLTEAKGNKEKLKLAVAFQFFYKGVPYVYYGDEVGIKGGLDPLCRKTMIWEETQQDGNLLSFFKQAISLRKAHRSLTYGDFKVETMKGEAFSFTRSLGEGEEGERILILFNLSHDAAQMEIGKACRGKALDLWTQTPVILGPEITLDSKSFRVLMIEGEKEGSPNGREHWDTGASPDGKWKE